MFYRKFLRVTLCSIPLTILGCAYHMQIEQGVPLQSAQLSQLKPGMTESQVQYLLGSPNLIDPYYPHCWYYIYTNQENDQPFVQQNHVVHFDSQGLMISHSS